MNRGRTLLQHLKHVLSRAFSGRELALLEYAEKPRNPGQMKQSDVQKLREVGYDDERY